METGIQIRPQTPHSSVPAALRHAFTLVELLTVLIIISLLLAILVPVIGRVRRSAYDASTKNEISEIAAACQRYYDDFKAYPGPISNSDIETQNYTTGPFQVTTPSGSGNLLSQAASPQPEIVQSSGSDLSVATTSQFFTASENLLLGLCGGLWVDPNTKNANSGKVEFVNSPIAASTSGNTFSTLIGSGPQTLVASVFSGTNTPNPGFKQFGAYLQVQFPGDKMLLNGDGSPESGTLPYHDEAQRTFNDCVIPVFTDAFPDHMPILYIRANVRAHGILSGDLTATTAVTDPTLGNSVAHYNYDLVELTPYTMAKAGVPLTGGGMVKWPGQHGLQTVDTGGNNEPNYAAFQPISSSNPLPTTPIPWNHPVPTNILGNAGQYFMDPSVVPSNTTATPGAAYLDENATGTPKEKDQFILIAAGPDRTYGTGDDDTNFGNVEP